MTYAFLDRLDYAGKRFNQVNTASAHVARPNSDLSRSSVPVSLIKTDRMELAMYGVTFIGEDRQDVAVDVADLSVMFPPEKGDRFTIGSKMFEVSPIGDKTWAFLTSSETRIRVHLKVFQ